MSDLDVFEDAVARVERIGREAGVAEEVIDALRRPKAVLSADVPVRMDDGATRHFEAFRCRYNDALGPTKGGIRFHSEMSQAEVMEDAFDRVWEIHEEEKVPLRSAAYRAALLRIAEAIESHGHRDWFSNGS